MCQSCENCYKHEAYSTLTKVHQMKHRCKLNGHREIIELNNNNCNCDKYKLIKK